MALCISSVYWKDIIHGNSVAHMVETGWNEIMQVRFSVFLELVFDNLSTLSPPHGSQRTESEMLMFLSTAIPCEVSAVQSAPHGEVNAVPGIGP